MWLVRVLEGGGAGWGAGGHAGPPLRWAPPVAAPRPEVREIVPRDLGWWSGGCRLRRGVVQQVAGWRPRISGWVWRGVGVRVALGAVATHSRGGCATPDEWYASAL